MRSKNPEILSHLAQTGAVLTLRVTPKASRNAVKMPEDDGPIRVYVTAVPEAGKANQAVLKLLAKALGVPKSRLEIMQGATGRDKRVRIL